MIIVSFAYVSPAVIRGRKTVTRRSWKDPYARRFLRGQRFQGWDKSPRFGGKKIAVCRLTANPTWEPLADMPDSDYEAEGFSYLHEAGFVPPASSGFEDFSFESFERWRQSGDSTWVIRFENVEVIDGADPSGREGPRGARRRHGSAPARETLTERP